MKFMRTGCLIALLTAAWPVLLNANEPAGCKDKSSKSAESEEITVCGTLIKAGSVFVVKTEDGAEVKIMPAKPGKKSEAPALDLNAYLGKAVKLTGAGKVREAGKKKKILMQTVTGIETAEESAPAAPAAEESAPAVEKPAPAVEEPAPTAPVKEPAADEPADIE